jgi:uncharacterized DUF497 family protein
LDIIDLLQPLEFDWDEANKRKIWLKHKVSVEECEEAFATEQIFSQPDELHSHKENRYILISKTQKLRFLFIIFTIRKSKVRVISARDMHRKEVDFYEKEAGST